MVDKLFGHVGIEVGRFDEAKEELVHDLKMRPCQLQYRFVLLWIESLS
jgi:hypothetical protein